MQRIKGLMTGSLPTFIDAGSNFASSSVEEDHLLHHLAAQYPYLYFMGDDTWQHLFPAALTPERTFASDSFKMFDLHTVDNRIQEQLWPLLDGTSSGDDWQVVIAHFLGVDHCGHTYGPDHTNMATKLEEMNSVLTRIVDHVDEDTLLVVMGDHGMSVEGDHGGESVEELMSGLLLHSGRPLTIDHHGDNDLTAFETSTYFDDLIGRMHQRRTSILGYDVKKISQRLHYNASAYSIVPQIHLAPTLAYLLHLPIPFGNLGALIPDILLHSDQNKTATFGDDVIGFRLDLLLHMAQQFRTNALQVYDYLITYGMEARHLGFTKNALAPLVQQLEKAEETMANAVLEMADQNMQQEHLTGVVTELLESSIFGYDAFLSNTIKYCEAIWAQFDVGCMLLGMVMLGTTTVVGIFFWLSRAYWPQMRIWNTKSLVNYVGSCSIWKTIGICALGTLAYIFSTHVRSQFLPGMFDKIGWIDILDYDGCLVLAAAIIKALTLGSNSFVIWEDRGTLFASMTLCICWLLRKGRTLETSSGVKTWTRCLSKPVLVMLWIRLGSLMGQCREEQYPHCSYV
ncbi:alkaline-phosphatase-like protein, partial [Absidia repens]